MNTPTFETSRLLLTPFALEESLLFQQISSDSFVRKFLWDDKVITLQTAEEIMVLNQNYLKQQGFGLWKIQSKTDQNIIGYTGLWYFFDEPQPQLIYALFEAFTGKGLATEAAQAMIDFAFQQLHFDYLVAAMNEDHLASQKVAQRLGMHLQQVRTIEHQVTAFYRLNRAQLKANE
ncbi:MAG: GNAT family N-acetyltransferase [Bacteroidota bacterium]